ncbi:hypothetical protein [Janibacter hoylei]|nr:hypothetical protein [Janibacter hoylei]MCT2293058.1 hypothetical protein [Janibacter hoylei]
MAGAAWAAPTIAIGSAAPAMAASRPPGLQGWVTVGKGCENSRLTLTINGTGGGTANPPDSNSRGLWVYNTNSSTSIANARVTIYYPNSLGTIAFSRVGSGGTTWSIPAVDSTAPARSGYTAYSTFYTGNWEFYDLNGVIDDHHRAVDRPNFTATINVSSCPNIQVYSWRTVQVDGQTISFTRGPISL